MATFTQVFWRSDNCNLEVEEKNRKVENRFNFQSILEIASLALGKYPLSLSFRTGQIFWARTKEENYQQFHFLRKNENEIFTTISNNFVYLQDKYFSLCKKYDQAKRLIADLRQAEVISRLCTFQILTLLFALYRFYE